MKLRKKIVSTVLASTLALGSVSFAADLTIKDKNTGVETDFLDYMANDDKFFDLAIRSDAYLVEFGGKLYEASKAVELTQDGKSLEEVINSGAIQPVGDVQGELKVESVSAINVNTIEVTFNNSLESVSASDFSIAGIEVKEASFKAETKNKVVVLKTTNQLDQTYTLKYKDLSKKFIGITNLGAVLLSADAYEVVIVPSENKLTPVEIKAELSGFPEGAEASIDFSTSFGKVVKSQTTQGGKTTFQLTPLETLHDQTAIVTGKVIEVKNPKTGETFPEFRNSTVNSINVKFTIKPKEDSEDLKSYKVDTAYAEQADRVYLRVSGGVDGIVGNSLNYQPQKLIKATTSKTEQQMYLHLHDVLFSNIQAVVDANKGAKTEAAIKKLKEELSDVFVVDGKEITTNDLRNILRKDTIGVVGSRYNEIYRPLKATKVSLDKEINAIPQETLQGILNYYKLLSKFVILDDVKDSQAPQTPDDIYPVEYVYREGNTLVLVLPGQRSNDSMDYLSNKYVQDKAVKAQFLKDNASHKVVFVNDINRDKYEITGDPAFKLEDASNVRLISVDKDRYKVQQEQKGSDGGVIENPIYCPVPYAVDVEDSDGYEPGEDGGTTGTPGKDPSYTGTVKLTAKNYTTSEDFRLFDKAEGVINADKLGELKIVFSESIAVQDKESALNPANWTINGKSLADVDGAAINLRLVSTDPTKQLRDAVIITFSSLPDGATTKRDVKWIESFIEEAAGRNHRIEISKAGDWASLTDSKNIIDTEAKDYKGTKAEDATAWANPYVTGGTAGSVTSRITSIAPGNAFVVRAAAQADISDATTGMSYSTTDNKDVIRVLFSEPMKIDGTDSVLEKANYALNGKALPVDGTSIKIGLKGVAGLENSPCGVTIELPNGTLGSEEKANTHVLTISNVKGVDDSAKLDERIQLAYARQYTITGTNIVINGKAITSDVVADDYVTSISGDRAAEGRVYLQEDKKTPVNITNAMSRVKEFFTKHIGATTTPGEEVSPEAAAASKKISDLPALTELKLTDKVAVVAARAEYDKLTAAQKAEVKNLSVLEAAEKKIADLEASVVSPEAAAAIKKISDLPALTELKLTDKVAVVAARAEYDKLTAAQKDEVSADVLKKLTDAEAKIAELEAQQGEAAQGTVNVATVGATEISRITIATADLGTQFRRQGDTNVKQYGETLQFVSTGKTKETIELLDANGDVVGTIVVELVKGTFNTAIQK